MRASLICWLPLGCMLAISNQSIAQAQELPDYTKRPLNEWLELLNSTEANEARRALGSDGPYAKVAVPALIDAFKDKRRPASSVVSEVLADYGPSIVPNLVRALKRPEPSVRAGVAQALGYVRPRALGAVPALMDAVKDPDPDVRISAASSLGSIGGSASKAVPSLIAALQDDNAEVRTVAAVALSRMGRKSKSAVPALTVALKDRDMHVREYAAWALAKIGPDAKAAVPALIEALRTEKENMTRVDLVRALGGIGPAAKDAVPALVEALQVRHYLLRPWSASALGDLGPAAKEAVPALIAAAKDKSNGNGGREMAMDALGRIGPDARAAVPMLIEELNVQDAQGSATLALGGIGAAAKAAIPALMAIVRDRLGRPEARKAAAEAIMKIDPELASREGMETAYLGLRLGRVPAIQLAPRPAITEGRKKRIKELIAKLADIENPDVGMSGTLSGHGFAPIPDEAHVEGGLLTNHGLKQSDALRSLVELGPEALPFLLEALEDTTPTKLKVEHRFGMGWMGFSTSIKGNPLNLRESRVLSKPKAASEDDDDDEEHDSLHSYRVKVGDVCFMAIGQMVGRRYDAVRYQPTAIIVIGSPSQSKKLREQVRALWSNSDPAKHLLDSLLFDYKTEGIFNGKSLDRSWSDGTNFQVQAAMRLLYYFPKEAAPLIADRLRSFDVRGGRGSDGWMNREVRNGVRTDKFIKSVSWCTIPVIQDALADIAKRTNDPDIKMVLERTGKRHP
jgi:HEAT repeat protein